MMTMPPIADVRAAAELFAKYPIGTGIDCTAEFERFSDARELLANFALAVLNAPGMSAERLELHCEMARLSKETGVSFDPAHHAELLAEVLRLRAEMESKDVASNLH